MPIWHTGQHAAPLHGAPGRPRALAGALVAAAAFSLVALYALYAPLYEPPASDQPPGVIVVPGGGQLPDGPPAHMRLRLAKAAELYRRHRAGGRAPLIAVLSGGTPHRPNPRDGAGFDIKEAESSARYLQQELGVPGDDILEEGFSLDTIGNAYWLRTVHTDPAALRRLVVVNNDWHLPRTRAIFEWVFGLPPRQGYVLDFVPCAAGIADAAALQARQEKERAALAALPRTTAGIRTMAELHRWLFTQHGAYRSARLLQARRSVSPALAKSY
eukprot:TRINITY_DN32657_c0_g1_i1.p2 TRINITY_DN32657_c0_g1~~TRINITY_DN32657_c0_g1_i1.p2  ORF type:complete len:300 (+),score=74.12 TRINITY_DN32657_c0_g1_i1:87-902(+)